MQMDDIYEIPAAIVIKLKTSAISAGDRTAKVTSAANTPGILGLYSK